MAPSPRRPTCRRRRCRCRSSCRSGRGRRRGRSASSRSVPVSVVPVSVVPVSVVPVSVVVVSVVVVRSWVCCVWVCVCSHVLGNRSRPDSGCPTAGAGAGSRRRESGSVEQRRSGPWSRPRCAADALAGADSRTRSGSARWSGSRRRPPGSGRRCRRRRGGRSRRPSTSAASDGRTRILIDRTPGARPSESGRRAARMAAAAPAMSYSMRRQRAIQALVSSSSQAARASPSRGWPTLPGLRIHSPSATSTSSPPRRADAGGRLALGTHEGQRHVRVADQRQALGLGVEAQLGQQGARGRTPRRDRAGDAW